MTTAKVQWIKQGDTERRNTTRNKIQHKQLRAQKRGTVFGGESLQYKEGSLVPFRSEARRLFEPSRRPGWRRLSYGEMMGLDGQLQRWSRISRSTRPGDPNFEEPRR